jgi:hypothetical protein
MWRPNEPVEEDVSAPLGIDPQGKRRRSRRRAWRDGLADQPSLRLLKMPAPTERSSAPSSAVLIPDPCSSLRSLID